MENNHNNFLKIGELPEIKILPLDRLVFHEQPHRERLLGLIERLKSEQVIKNPPIVARVKGFDKFIILDGANRVTALEQLGYRFLPVQIVSLEDPLLSLHSWNHAVERLGKQYFIDNIQKVEGARILVDTELDQLELDAPDSFDPRPFVCHFTFADESTMAVTAAAEFGVQLRVLRDITALYLDKPISDRVSYANLNHLRYNYPNFSTLLTFRKFDKDDFRKILDEDIKIPAGITRVFLPKRALGINISLNLLDSETELEEKNRLFNEIVLQRVRSRSIRFYREATFVFDE